MAFHFLTFDCCGSSDIGHCFIARVNEITDQGFVCFDDPILCSDPLIGWNWMSQCVTAERQLSFHHRHGSGSGNVWVSVVRQWPCLVVITGSDCDSSCLITTYYHISIEGVFFFDLTINARNESWKNVLIQTPVEKCQPSTWVSSGNLYYNPVQSGWRI